MTTREQSGAEQKGRAVTPGGQASYLDWSHRNRSHIFLYLVAIVAGFVGWQFGSIPALFLMSEDPAQRSVEFQFTFLIPALLLLVLVRVLFGRPGWTVAFPVWPPRWSDYLVGIAIGWAVMVLLLILLLLFLPGFKLTYRGLEGMITGGPSMILMLCAGFAIQTAFEELYFRGLMMQALRRLARFVPLILVVQAYLFAQLHTANLEVSGSYVFKLVPYLAAALYLGWVAWRTGSLLMPMGLHFANNAWSALFINSQGDVIQTAAPFIGPPGSLNLFIGYSIAQAILVTAAVEFVVRRRSALAA